MESTNDTQPDDRIDISDSGTDMEALEPFDKGAPEGDVQEIELELTEMTGSRTSRATACINTDSRQVGPRRARPFR